MSGLDAFSQIRKILGAPNASIPEILERITHLQKADALSEANAPRVVRYQISWTCHKHASPSEKYWQRHKAIQRIAVNLPIQEGPVFQENDMIVHTAFLDVLTGRQ